MGGEVSGDGGNVTSAGTGGGNGGNVTSAASSDGDDCCDRCCDGFFVALFEYCILVS